MLNNLNTLFPKNKVTLSLNSKCFNFYTDDKYQFKCDFMEEINIKVTKDILFKTNFLRYYFNTEDLIEDLAEDISLDNPRYSERDLKYKLIETFEFLTELLDLQSVVVNDYDIDINSLNNNELERLKEYLNKD